MDSPINTKRAEIDISCRILDNGHSVLALSNGIQFSILLPNKIKSNIMKNHSSVSDILKNYIV